MKRLVFLFLLLPAFLSTAQVIYDNNAACGSSNGVGSTATISNVTVPANNKALLVVAVKHNENDAATVTFNGQNFTLFDHSSAGRSSEIWYLKLGDLAAPITADVFVTTSGGHKTAAACSFHNVDQVTPMDNPSQVSFTNANTSISNTVNTNLGDFVFNAVSARIIAGTTGNLTPTSGQTVDANCTNVTGGSFDSRMVTTHVASSGASETITWDVSQLSSDSGGAGKNHAVNIRSAGQLIPTMGEWALILFGLIVLSFGVVYIMKWQKSQALSFQ